MASGVQGKSKARGLGWALGVVVLSSLAAALACSSEKETVVGQTACQCSSDCTGGRVKAFGLCREPCHSTRDCSADERCVLGDSVPVCLPRGELNCHFNSDCGDPLLCAADMMCRNTCQVSSDCVEDDVCAHSQVCAAATEVTTEGDLVGAPGGSSAGANAGGASHN